ncbi:unnamed protein product [Sphagnum balticum]
MSGRNQRGGSSQRQYRGIRMRRWGKWVSEIREPSTRTRIWLGSFRTAEEAAHAYDAALVCIRGPNAQLNFPNDPPTIPRGTPGRYSTREIQAAAAASAAASILQLKKNSKVQVQTSRFQMTHTWDKMENSPVGSFYLLLNPNMANIPFCGSSHTKGIHFYTSNFFWEP